MLSQAQAEPGSVCLSSHSLLPHGAVGLHLLCSSLILGVPNQIHSQGTPGHSCAEQQGQSLPSTLLLTQPKPLLTSGHSWSPSCPQGLFCKAAPFSNARAGLVFACAEHHGVPITLLLQPVMVPLKSRPVTSLLHLASPTARLRGHSPVNNHITQQILRLMNCDLITATKTKSNYIYS